MDAGPRVHGAVTPAAPREWLAAGRDRMDERVDMSRAIRDGRYLYIRNFHPDRAQGEYLAYMFETPTTQVWKARHDAGRLDAVQDAFWREKSPEELYDLAADPDAVRNLAGDPAHAAGAGALPRRHARAPPAYARPRAPAGSTDMHRRRGATGALCARAAIRRLPLERILDAADLATCRRPADAARMRAGLADGDPAVRYWSALGLRLIGAGAVRTHGGTAAGAAGRPRPAPRVAAADALARFGDPCSVAMSLATLLATADYRRDGNHAAMLALDVIVALGPLADPIRAERGRSRPGRMCRP